MILERFIPHIRNSFRTTRTLEEVDKNLQNASKELGYATIEYPHFNIFPKDSSDSGIYIDGEIKALSEGFEISYDIRMHPILTMLYWVTVPLLFVLFFVDDNFKTFDQLLGIESESMALRLVGLLLTILIPLIAWYLIFQLRMNDFDKVIQKAFGKQPKSKAIFFK